MEVCSGSYQTETHDEIVHNERQCPLCAALTEIKSLKGEVERLNNQE